MKHSFLKALILFLMVSLLEAQIDWGKDLDKALKVAKEDEKPVIVFFFGKWNRWSVKLIEFTENSKEAKELSKKAIFVKLELPQYSDQYSPKQLKYKKLYQSSSLPLVVVLDKEGKPLGKAGYPRDSSSEYFAKLKSLAQIKDKEADKKAEEASQTQACLKELAAKKTFYERELKEKCDLPLEGLKQEKSPQEEVQEEVIGEKKATFGDLKKRAIGEVKSESL